MQSEYTIHPDNNLIQVRYEGGLSMNFIIGRIELLKQDPLFNAGMSVIVDFSKAAFDFDVQLLERDMAPAYRKLVGQQLSKTALILDSPESTAFGLIFQNANPGRIVEIFSTRQAAEDWALTRA